MIMLLRFYRTGHGDCRTYTPVNCELYDGFMRVTHFHTSETRNMAALCNMAA